MKILNLHTCPNGLFTSERNSRGGLEKVVYDLHTLMLENGVEIHSVCSPNDISSMKQTKNFHPINYSETSEWRGKNWELYKSKLWNLIEQIEPTMVIVHGTNKLLKVFNEWKLPVMFIDHQGHGSINKLYHYDFYNKVVPENRIYGGLIFGVSEISTKIKEDEIKKQKISDNFQFDGDIIFQYVTDELASYKTYNNPSHTPITIGIPEPYKQIHKIESVRKKGIINDYTIITIKPDKPKQKIIDYLEKNIENNPEINKRILYNITREETMKRLSCSSLYVSTSPYESAGITAFEAMSFGVPVLFAFKNGSFASTMYNLTGEGYSWHKIDSSTIQRLPYIDREYIKDSVRNRFSKKNVFEDMINIFEFYNRHTPFELKNGLDYFV